MHDVSNSEILVLVLDVLVITVYLSMIVKAVVSYAYVRLWFYRIPLIPYFDNSAYLLTIVLYGSTGVYLWCKYGWKSIVVLAAIGGIQELTDLMLSVIYPWMIPINIIRLLAYWVLVTVLTPLIIILQTRLFRFKFTKYTLIFPLFYAYYVGIGMPTYVFDHTIIAFTYEMLYVSTILLSYSQSIVPRNEQDRLLRSSFGTLKQWLLRTTVRPTGGCK